MVLKNNDKNISNIIAIVMSTVIFIIIIISLLLSEPMYEEIFCNQERCVYNGFLLLNKKTQYLDSSTFKFLGVNHIESSSIRYGDGIYHIVNQNNGLNFPLEDSLAMSYCTFDGANNALRKLQSYSSNPYDMKIRKIGMGYIVIFVPMIFVLFYFFS